MQLLGELLVRMGQGGTSGSGEAGFPHGKPSLTLIRTISVNSRRGDIGLCSDGCVCVSVYVCVCIELVLGIALRMV